MLATEKGIISFYAPGISKELRSFVFITSYLSAQDPKKIAARVIDETVGKEPGSPS